MSEADTVEYDSNTLEDNSVNDELLQFSSSEKELERKRLQEEIEAYLTKGGAIRQIPANLRADPPKKPQSNYGGQPI